MSYYARFIKVHNELFRLETRIYLEEMPKIPNEKDGVCVAAIIGKNPGSARPTQLDKWTSLNLGKDKMLPYVRNRFLESYRLAGKTIPHGAFVRIWNLFYLCNAKFSSALKSVNLVGSQALDCPSEKGSRKIVWFAWGGFDLRLNSFKERFQKMNVEYPFFFDKKSRKIIERIPSETDLAKHPQGLRGEPIEKYLASIL
jgi:hypothetical protein